MKNLTVTWEDEDGTDITKISGHTFVNGINVDGVQNSTLTVEEAVKNTTYTCTLYPEEAYSTDVHLYVTNSDISQGVSTIFTCLLVLLFPWQ